METKFKDDAPQDKRLLNKVQKIHVQIQ